MLQHSHPSDFLNQILILEDASPRTAIEYLKSFADDYRLDECRSFLWSLVKICLTTENDSFSDAEDRADLLLKEKDFDKLFEAVFVIADYWNHQSETISSN